MDLSSTQRHLVDYSQAIEPIHKNALGVIIVNVMGRLQPLYTKPDFLSLMLPVTQKDYKK